MAGLRLRCLGGLHLEFTEGEPVDLRLNKSRALICYLAVSGRSFKRTALAGLLWGELPEVSARANLRSALVSLRRVLPEHVLVTQDEVVFNRDALYELDVETFARAVRDDPEIHDVARLREAADLYRGAFLEGVSFRDAPLFDEWVAAQREQLERTARQVLHALAHRFKEQRDYIASTDYFNKLLILDEWQEEVHRALMLVFAESGQPGAALAQFELCRRTLADGLGIEPSLETVALAHEIRNGEIESKLSAAVLDNLPIPPTRLLGREAVLADLVGHLEDPDARLLTLTGTGGIGKSRLALELAWLVQSRFVDGAFFVLLSDVEHPSRVADAIANALDVRGKESQPSEERLRTFLRRRQVLLVLDNFEHLQPSATLVADLLSYCPDLKVVTTSRSPLHLRGEHEIEVPPLMVPNLGRLQGTDNVAPLLASPAVELFYERATAVGANLGRTADDVSRVANICVTLDGLPLAIELAAAKCKFLSLQAVLVRLNSRLDFLTNGARDLPDRQRTLRATIAWSYDLLDATQQTLFKRLAVTVGSFGLKLAVTLSDDEREPDGLDTLASLVDRNLLQRVETDAAEPRARMLESVRAFAQEQLAEDARELHESRERHASYFASSLRGLYPDLTRDDQSAWQSVEQDSPNIQAAWLWAASEKRTDLMHQASVFWFFATPGRYRRGLYMFEQAAQLLGGHGGTQMTCRLQGSLAWLYLKTGQMPDALYAAEQSVSAARSSGRTDLLSVALETLGGVQLMTGAYAEAEATYLQVLAELDPSESQRAAGLRSNLANLAAARGNFSTSLELYERCLEQLQPSDSTAKQALILARMGGTYFMQGDLRAAERLLEQAYATANKVEDGDVGMAAALELGFTLTALGALKRAETLLYEALDLSLAADDTFYAVWARLGLADLAVNRGDRSEAAFHLCDALSRTKELGRVPLALSCLLRVARLWHSCSVDDEACLLASFIENHRAVAAYDRSQAEQLLAELGCAAAPRSIQHTELPALYKEAMSRLETLSDRNFWFEDHDAGRNLNTGK